MNTTANTFGELLSEAWVSAPGDWTEEEELKCFKAEQAITSRGTEYNESLECGADYYQNENGIRFYISGPSWAVEG